jgi:hypothetical protein
MAFTAPYFFDSLLAALLSLVDTFHAHWIHTFSVSRTCDSNHYQTPPSLWLSPPPLSQDIHIRPIPLSKGTSLSQGCGRRLAARIPPSSSCATKDPCNRCFMHWSVRVWRFARCLDCWAEEIRSKVATVKEVNQRGTCGVLLAVEASRHCSDAFGFWN